MSQRNRIVYAAIIVVMSFTLTAPAPIFAAGLPQGSTPPQGVWELAWSWLIHTVSPATSPHRVTGRFANEGGAIDPNGRSAPVPTLPTLKPAVMNPGGGQ